MATFTHDFTPGDIVFVVTNETCVDGGKVLQYTHTTYLDSDNVVQTTEHYIILRTDDDTTVRVTPDFVYSTVDLALEHVKNVITVV